MARERIVVSTHPKDGPVKGKEVVMVFVRKGTLPDTRLLSFRRPMSVDIPDRAFLARGYAFDGNAVITEVTKRTKAEYVTQNQADGGGTVIFLHEADEERTLSQALVGAELAIQNWLEELGLSVSFV